MNMEPQDDDYLWDKSGAADPEVVHLERLLKRYRYDRARDGGIDSGADAHRPASTWKSWVLALAAALAIALGARMWWSSTPRAGYEVIGLAGLDRVHAGESFETSAGQTATVRVATLGDVEVQPGSRVRVDDAGEKVHKLYLDRGSVSATIFAKPEQFQIGTPAGLSVDLGCKYDLSVSDDGVSTMTVTFGRVRFEAHGKSVIVPKGSMCTATREDGPCIPVPLDMSPEFRDAALRLERADPPDPRDIDTVCDRELDIHEKTSVTIWHLFTNAESAEVRAKMFEQLTKVYPPPAGCDVAALENRDAKLVAAWRETITHDWGFR
jgi:hypothetical protein